MSLQNMYGMLGMDMYNMYPQLAALHGIYPPNHLPGMAILETCDRYMSIRPVIVR